MLIKPGVDTSRLLPPILNKLAGIDRIFKSAGVWAVIICTYGPRHFPGSLHNANLAIGIKTPGVRSKEIILEALYGYLGKKYKIIWGFYYVYIGYDPQGSKRDPHHRKYISASVESKIKPRTTKQEIVILLTKPEAHIHPTATNPTIRYIQRGLKIHFQRTITARHISRLLTELEREGVLMRYVTAWNHKAGEAHEQASYYTIIDFNKAFQNVADLKNEPRKSKHSKNRT